MFSLGRACTAAAVLAALTSLVDRDLAPVVAPPDQAVRKTAPRLLRPCPPNTLLDNQVCVPVPDSLSEAPASAESATWQIYDSILRQPERPGDHHLYQYPVAFEQVQPSPFGKSGAAQAALLLGAPLNSPVKLQEIEGQIGSSAVLFSGELIGKSVVTEHRVQETGLEQTYLILFGNLASITARAGSQLKVGATLGSVGNSATGHAVGLHLEVRRVRHGIDARELHSDDFLSRASTIACDPRNVFRLKPSR